jgi:RimJ/RimL family protein N-acetyltransferase
MAIKTASLITERNAVANWIEEDVQLTGNLVRLEPLAEAHFDALNEVSKDEQIWKYLKHDGLNPAQVPEYLEEAMVKKAKGIQYPFTIFEQATNKIIGTTRFWRMDRANKKLDLGWTWLNSHYWGGNYNLEAKYLLLGYCFEKLEAIKVSMVASEDNVRSRKAIEKLGAQLDGVLRKERICADGISRGFAYYSIIDEEWPAVKAGLLNKLKQ